MKEGDHFKSKNMSNAPECGKLHLLLSKLSGETPKTAKTPKNTSLPPTALLTSDTRRLVVSRRLFAYCGFTHSEKVSSEAVRCFYEV